MHSELTELLDSAYFVWHKARLVNPASPRNGGWYDSSGEENGDKCAWTFNVPFVTFTNGTTWKIQGEWSNHAYNTGTGYPNSSGQDGCLDGH